MSHEREDYHTRDQSETSCEQKIDFYDFLIRFAHKLYRAIALVVCEREKEKFENLNFNSSLD
jgi:hypothetical protein